MEEENHRILQFANEQQSRERERQDRQRQREEAMARVQHTVRNTLLGLGCYYGNDGHQNES